MKTKAKLLFILGIAIAMTACMQSPEGERVQSGDAVDIEFPKDAKTVKPNLEKSKIEWLGTKPSGTHWGTIGIKDGTLYIKDGQLLGGEFTIDMNSIVVLDIEDPKPNQNLVNHLKSADFFLVDSFPTSKFIFSSVLPFEGSTDDFEEIIPTHRIAGNLTMRGITRKVSFPAKIDLNNKMVKAKTPQFILNRTEWNVNYGSKSIFANLKDNFIHDEMGVTITLSAE